MTERMEWTDEREQKYQEFKDRGFSLEEAFNLAATLARGSGDTESGNRND